ncbi:MAG: hypothetical protein ACRCYU_15730 [Nocardioides sp.]
MTISSNLPTLHVPARILSRGVLKSRVWLARCTCGAEGPTVTDPGLAEQALVDDHGCTEPAGCYVCGHVEPQSDRWPTSWRRYWYQEVDGEWVVRCRRASCGQQQLGLVAAAEQATEAIAAWGEDFDPLRDGSGTSQAFEVSLQAPYEGIVDDGGVTSATMNFQFARMNSPRSWAEITTSARDRRALVAGAVGLYALLDVASHSVRHWVLAARRAGATWDELADAIEFGDGEEYRLHFIKAEVEGFDWPLPIDGSVLGPLLGPDGGDAE